MTIMAEPDGDVCVDEICGLDLDLRSPQDQAASYSEMSREFRRTVFMHAEWEKHRSSDRFCRNLQTIGDSGVAQALARELSAITVTSVFCVVINMLLVGYQDFSGAMQPAPLAWLDVNVGAISLPALPFSIMMPALSLLLVFRTNTGYSRWNEARTLWGGVINNCRNMVRQANLYFPDDDAHDALKDTLSANTALFAKALRNFLRGPNDDEALRRSLLEQAAAGRIPAAQAEACMAAKNRAFFCLNAMSANLRHAKLDPIERARIDTTISVLGDLTGACERIFKSPVPLVYTRHTSRFLATFLLFLPFAMWPAMDKSWNHWATVPVTDLIAFFLLGIEEIGIQIEEPFSILPLEAFCDGAIAAVGEELIEQKKAKELDFSNPAAAAAVPLAAAEVPSAAVAAPAAAVEVPSAPSANARTEGLVVPSARRQTSAFFER